MLSLSQQEQITVEFKDAACILQRAANDYQFAAMEMGRPSAIYHPSLVRDGNKWSALYGPDIQQGVCGFGDSPNEAMMDFDREWHKKIS